MVKYAKRRSLEQRRRTCACGAIFFVDRHEGKANPQKSCSLACVAKMRRTKMTVVCRACQKEFEVIASRASTAKYCSMACKPPYRGGWTKDHNHPTLVNAFTRLGCLVAELHTLGGGVPDLLVCYLDTPRLVEVKNPKTTYGRAGLNKNQIRFASRWPVEVVRTEQDAEALIEKWMAEHETRSSMDGRRNED